MRSAEDEVTQKHNTSLHFPPEGLKEAPLEQTLFEFSYNHES